MTKKSTRALSSLIVISILITLGLMFCIPLFVPHSNFHFVNRASIDPVINPYDGSIVTRILRIKAGYEYEHSYSFKGYPNSMHTETGGASVDIKGMRETISTSGTEGTFVLEIQIKYTLPNHAITCSLITRKHISLVCTDLTQQESFRIP